MTTVLDIVTLALKDAGIVGLGQTPSATDSNDAFTRLNWMLSSWQRKPWNVWHTVDVAKVSTGAQSYTCGPGGDFSIAYRPEKLRSAFFRQTNPPNPNQVDYNLEILDSRDDYNRIPLKQMVAFPSYVYYDAAMPQANVFFWPVPQAAIYEMHIVVTAQLAGFTSLQENVDYLPPEYFSALHSNLACVLRDAYGLPPKPALMMKAKGDLNTIKVANTQIGRLTVPAELVRPGIYNPYSDRVR